MENIEFTPKLKDKIRAELSLPKNDLTPTQIAAAMNLVQAAIAAHKHAFARLLSKEKFMEWVSDSWDIGAHQYRVYNMEVEGGIMNEYGVAMEFMARLALFGVQQGFLPKE